LQIAPGQVQIEFNSLRANTAPALITITKLSDSVQTDLEFNLSSCLIGPAASC
jgi:hypothetical protein